MGPPASHKIPRASWYSGSSPYLLLFAYRILTFCDRPSQAVRLSIQYSMRVLQPRIRRYGLGSSLFARRYFGNRFFFLFLRVLRCFSSPGSPPRVMDWRVDARGLPARVSPFRDLRIDGYLLLPEAFRSLSRLSSALSAKASTLRPYCLTITCIALHVKGFLSCFSFIACINPWLPPRTYPRMSCDELPHISMIPSIGYFFCMRFSRCV